MTLSQIKRILVERDIRLTKSLGQNFMHDGNQLDRIVASAQVQRSDQILEVGPGLGPLTEKLLEVGASVLALEMDRRLVAYLVERFSQEPRLTVVETDALPYLRNSDQDWGGWKIVANLPYSVASPVLVELALKPRPPRLMTVTLQHEVACRLSARAGDSDYGVLSLLVGLAFEPSASFRIAPECFFPVPDVESDCLTLTRREDSGLTEAEKAAFVRLVKRGFSQRRKMMMKLLKADWPEAALREAFAELELSRQIRAEKVSREQFVRLSRVLVSSTA